MFDLINEYITTKYYHIQTFTMLDIYIGDVVLITVLVVYEPINTELKMTPNECTSRLIRFVKS